MGGGGSWKVSITFLKCLPRLKIWHQRQSKNGHLVVDASKLKVLQRNNHVHVNLRVCKGYLQSTPGNQMCKEVAVWIVHLLYVALARHFCTIIPIQSRKIQSLSVDAFQTWLLWDDKSRILWPQKKRQNDINIVKNERSYMW